MIRSSAIPATLFRMAPPGASAGRPAAPAPEPEGPPARLEVRSPGQSLAWMALGALALAALPSMAQAAPASQVQEGTLSPRATDPTHLEALKQAGQENPLDNPTAVRLKARYRQLLTRTLKELDFFQARSRELAQYRVLDVTGGDFSVTQDNVVVSRRGDTLTISSRGTGGQVTLVNSPTRRSVSAHGLVRTLYLASGSGHRAGDFEVASRRERLTLRAGALERQAVERGQTIRESFRLPSVTIALYPGPVLEGATTALRGRQQLSSRSVTVRQDGGTSVQEQVGPEVRTYEEAGGGSAAPQPSNP